MQIEIIRVCMGWKDIDVGNNFFEAREMYNINTFRNSIEIQITLKIKSQFSIIFVLSASI